MTRIILAVAIVAAVLGSATSVANAGLHGPHGFGSVPYEVGVMIQAAKANPSWSGCVTLPGITMGQTGMVSHELQLNKRRVCEPIVKYARTQRLTNWTIDAIATIGHEAAHLRGVTNERLAECAGVRFAYSYLRSTGAYREYDPAGVKSQLLDDSVRPAQYKLNGTCSIR